VERGQDHAVLTLNRAERRNALSVALRNAISDALEELATDPTV
jgi:enoyl-CoA hydratase/carnithine racemase